MTKPNSMAFKQKMVNQLGGSSALTAIELSRRNGVRQQNDCSEIVYWFGSGLANRVLLEPALLNGTVLNLLCCQ